jgi:hydroxymethylglutaryl-CoA reductase (NADPH)
VVPGAVEGANKNEQILIVSGANVDKSLRENEVLSTNGVTWKQRSNNRIAKYVDYSRAGVAKIRRLIAGAESFDIMLIVVAYIAMWYTLIKVFYDMKQVGSNFWLAFSTMISGVFAFVFALFTTTKILGSKVSVISITEGIPFLVAIVGFKHKVSIANAVMKLANTSEVVPVIVADSISSHTMSLMRDSFVVIAGLLSCAAYAPHLEGLRNFCILSAMILAYDLVLLYTFFSAILALKIEINRARKSQTLKEALEEDGVDSIVAQAYANQSSSDSKQTPKLISPVSSIFSFKLAMIAGFLAFHVFYLGSSWLYTATDSVSFTIFKTIPSLTEATASKVTIGRQGTIITILPPKFFVPNGAFVQIEDFVFSACEQVSRAIRDKLLSKALLFALIVSVFTNGYFLNASRHQSSTTSILIEQTKKAELKHAEAEAVARASRKNSKKSSSKPKSNGHDKKNFEQCVQILKDGNVKTLNDDQVSDLVVKGKLPLYALEKQLADNTRAVAVRRKAIAELANAPVLNTDKLPFEHYDYDRVFGACCENVIGYMPLPVGVAGPMIIDDKPYHIPMATTEGCLVASTMRGCKAINAGGGVETVLTHDGMTRGPCVQFPTLKRAGAAKIWLDSEEGQKTVKKAFNSTSRFARLQNIKTALAGTLLFIRFSTTTGDAMGMNMISKGVEYSLKYMTEECGWHDMEVISVSGNYCTDKKPAAINWIEGRGKSIVAEARIPAEVVKKVLKSDVDALVELNISKNLVGSAMAGSVGGFNAHAANLVTAVYLACGQDPAQNVESSNCITLMKNVGGDLQISVSMPSIEVGTIGGGTILEPQGAMLELLGVKGPHPTEPGANARQLAKIVASAVLAAELSLCAALAAGHLVQSHMQHNRKAGPTIAAPPQATSNGAIDIERLKEGSINCIKS